MTINKPYVNPKLLQQLRDMGFPRELCVMAMQAIGGRLDAATNYLLNNPLPLLQKSIGGQIGLGREEEDLKRAIAMWLGDNVIVSTEAAEAGAEIITEPKQEEQKKEEEEEK